MDKIKELEEKIQGLRDDWKKATSHADRRVLEARAFMLRMALEKVKAKVFKNGQGRLDI